MTYLYLLLRLFEPFINLSWFAGTFLCNRKAFRDHSTAPIAIHQQKFLLRFAIVVSLTFVWAVTNAQSNSFFSSTQSITAVSSNYSAESFDQNNFYSSPAFTRENVNHSNFAGCTAITGNWNDAGTWDCGHVPGPGDDVIIPPGVTVTITDNTGSCQNISINNNGSLLVKGPFNLDVNGDWTNNGTFDAGTGTVTFKGTAGTTTTISGSSLTAFYNITIDKGNDVHSIVEAKSSGTISNRAALTITNGLFKVTGGTFQFLSGTSVEIPSTAGLWVNGGTVNSVSNGNNGFSVDNSGWIKISSGTLHVGTAPGNSLTTSGTTAKLEITGGAVNIAGGLVNTNGTVIITGGIINISTIGHSNSTFGSFHMNHSAGLTISGDPVINIQHANGGTGGDITILNSTGPKTITGGAFQLGPNGGTYKIDAAIPLYNLTILNPNVSAQLGSVITDATTYAYDLAIINQLTLNGQLQLNDQNLILGAGTPAVAGTLGANSGMIITKGTGEVRKISSVTTAYTFPVGTSASEYSPVSISFTSITPGANPYVGVRVVNNKHPNNPNTNNFLKRYWNVRLNDITNAIYNATATYLPGDIAGDEGNIRAGEYNNTPSRTNHNQVNRNSHTLTVTGIKSAGELTAASGIALAASTTTTISSDNNPACESTQVTFTATVTDGASPTGTVEFFDGGVSIGTASVTTLDITTGIATLAISTLGSGSHTITAAYSGDLNNLASTSTDLTQNITALPVATFSYAGSPYCQNAANPVPTFSGGGVAGTFSSTLGLVFANANTGEIDLATSTPGTYTVTNTIAAAGGCSQVTATSSVTVTALPVATFSYAGSPYCQNGANPVPTFSGGGVAGTFSSSPGLVFANANTGEINLATSTPGTYTVTNTIAAASGCPDVTATSSVTITALPVATFSYAASPYCQNATNPIPTFSGGGVAGTFSSTPGLVFANANTGEIDLAASTPGTYTVTNTIAAAGGCPDVTATSSVTITALPVATFGYAGSPYCQNSANPVPTFSGGAEAGTFSSTPGLVFANANTGEINLATSTPGTYTVTNTIAAVGGCPDVTATSSVTITALPIATFSYAGSPYCQNSANPVPTFSGGGVAGTFSSTPGLVFANANTGEINLATSTPGTYTVTNTIAAAGGCSQVTATSSVTITALPVATFNYAGSPYCKNAANPSPTFSGGGVAGTFSSTAGLNFVSTSTGQVNLSTSTAGTYTVTNTIAASGGCPAVTATSSITITAVPTATISYAGAPFCTSITTSRPVTLSGTGAYTGGTFSSTAGLSIDPSTGAITPSTSAAGTYTVTYTIPASGGCAAVPVTTSVTINGLPTISISPASTTICSGNNVTITASCTANCGANPTYSWSPAGDLSVSTGTTVIAFPSATTTYTVTVTGAAGCTNTATSTINVTPSPKGDLSSAAPVCAGSNSGTITLSNYTGTVVQWESSTDGGNTWTVITPTTPTTYNFSNLTQTTAYRVLLTLNNGCDAYSGVGVVPVQPVFTPTVTTAPNPATICLGQSVTLTASNYGPPPFPVENFQNANPAGWNGNNAGGNNGDPNSSWAETNGPKTFNGVIYNSNAPPTNSKFMVATGDGGGSPTGLTTPPFSLVGVNNPTFNFYTAMNLTTGASAQLQISTNGGLSYSNLSVPWLSGPSTYGTSNNGWQQVSIDLSAYIGQSNLKVRFLYTGVAGSNWGIDNVGISGTYQPVTYQWSPTTYMTPSDGVGRIVTVTPTATGSIQYCVVATTASGCVSNPVCQTVTVNPLPVVTTTNACIGGGTVTFTQTGGATGGTWTVSGGGTIVAATGVFTPTTPGCFTATYTTPSPGCTDTKNFVVFPAAPNLTAIANTCNSKLANITAVATVAGFTAEYAVQAPGGTLSAYSDLATTNALLTNTPGCWTIKARYKLTADCSGTTAGTLSSNVACQEATINAVVFPPVPALTPIANTCNSKLPDITAVADVAGFTVEYAVQIPGGALSAYGDLATANALLTNTPGCWTIKARYKLTAACGGTAANATSANVACQETTINAVVFPGAPVLTTPTNTCSGSFTLPTILAIPGFTVQYSIDGGAYSASPTIPVVPGCHTVQAQYILTAACGNTTAGAAGTASCGTSNIVSVVIFPAAPPAPTVNGGCGPIIVTNPPAVAGFNIEYSFDDGATWGANTPPTAENCGSYQIRTRYVLATDCGGTIAGAAGPVGCNVSPATTRKLDHTAPAVTCPTLSPVCQVAGGTYIIPALVASDNCSSNLTITYEVKDSNGVTIRSGSGVDASGTFSVGISTITWTVTDECGNTNSCTTQVTIYPKPTPIIYHN
jgi:hypothetical protein